MSININRKRRTYDDAINAFQNYTHKWQDFIIQCPDLLNINWFYEGGNITDTMAVDMRRLVSVWTMLYGTDVVRIILSVMDYPTARLCRQDLFRAHVDPDANYCVTAFVAILVALGMSCGGVEDTRLERLFEMTAPLKLDYFEQAWNIVRPN